MPTDPQARIEVRRLVEWFTIKCDAEATSWLVQEKIFKRHSPQGGAPDIEQVKCQIWRSQARGGLSNLWGRGIEPPYGDEAHHWRVGRRCGT